MMGSGKTTLGRKLAKSMQRQFIDLDDKIESTAGMTIAALFEERGDEYFRDMESRALEEVSIVPECVVALGGGALLRADNLQLVLRSGTLVYLRLTEPGVISRLSGIANTERPLLAGRKNDLANSAALQDQQVRQLTLLRERLPGYESAQIQVDMDGVGEIESFNRLKTAIIRDGFSVRNE
jgi:shikimate kinase